MLKRKLSDAVEKWLDELDWVVKMDCDDDYKPIYCIHELDDHSVGMIGSQISPDFRSVDQLEIWCKNMMEGYEIKFK